MRNRLSGEEDYGSGVFKLLYHILSDSIAGVDSIAQGVLGGAQFIVSIF